MLALLAAAGSLRAQDPGARRPGADSTADSTARKRKPLTAADTLKAPVAAAPLPVVTTTGVTRTSWDRDQLFATGALTLGELVTQVPGVTRMATGFLHAPEALAWHGNPGAVVVFVDGVERDEIAPRTGGVADFSLVPLWALEQVTVEETPMQLRVHARTWRVTRTTPSTRVDVLTGSENLNLFRGYFGKRAANGAVIQLAAQQMTTASVPGLDGQSLGAFARFGWAGGPWSVDATMLRQGIDRNPGVRFPFGVIQRGAMPAFKGSSSLAYLRLAYGSADSGRSWIQLTAATEGAVKTHVAATTSSGGSSTPPDTADTTSSRSQLRVSMGRRLGAVRLWADLRQSAGAGLHGLAGVGRAEWATASSQFAASAGRTTGGALAWDARAAYAVRPWLRLSGSAGAAATGIDSGTAHFGTQAAAAVRVRDRWISVGLVRTSALTVAAPVELDTAMRAASVPDGSAWVIGVDGPLAMGLRLHTDVVNWNGAHAFRPQTEATTRVIWEPDLAGKYPQANFHVQAAFVHQFRTTLYVPLGSDALGQSTAGYSTIGTQLEIRIGTAVISWAYRNIPGANYYTFPGYLMPRITSVYGVRWEFWN